MLKNGIKNNPGLLVAPQKNKLVERYTGGTFTGRSDIDSDTRSIYGMSHGRYNMPIEGRVVGIFKKSITEEIPLQV